jgi:hypothetical protein
LALPTKRAAPPSAAAQSSSRGVAKRSENKIVNPRNIQDVDVNNSPASSGKWTEYKFVTQDGKAACWRLGHESADQFMTHLAGLQDELFKSPTVRIYFRAVVDGTERLLLRKKLVTMPVTLQKVLREIDVTLQQVAALGLIALGSSKVDEHKADSALRQSGIMLCNMSIRREGGANQVVLLPRGVSHVAHSGGCDCDSTSAAELRTAL